LSTDGLHECLARIADPAGQGAKAFIRIFREAVEAPLQPGPLGGIPVSVKDLCDVAGSITTAGSKVLASNLPALYDAPVVARIRAAGAVILGTNNMTEFAMGGVGINPHYGTPLNPWDRVNGRIPGGSSSGGAVAVADGMVNVALGSDTAGSIQMPAAFCGIVGFKPTARRVPMAGTIPLAPSLDSLGPLARSVADCARFDAVIAGEPDESLVSIELYGLRFAVPQALVLDDLEAPVAQAFSSTLSRLSSAGVEIVEIPLVELRELPALSFSVIEGYAWHRKLLEERSAE
jgi:aspartyl-tRNA(Asn)/glutamyl-tRNA(Gln) amidotransferase subunit A